MNSLNKREKIFRVIIILGSILASLKMIFVGYNLDEEYQVVMAYRNVIGDKLFMTMWEPHQTSAFLCAFFEAVFIKLTGDTTGIVVYLRTIGILIQAAIAFFLYATIKPLKDKNSAFIIAFLFFNISPKLFAMPEFSNLQFWFISLSLMLIFKYFQIANVNKKGAYGSILLAAAFYSLSVLAYPSMVILIVVFNVILVIFSEGSFKKTAPVFFDITCAGLGALYVLYFAASRGFGEFIKVLKLIPTSDLTHSIENTIGGENKLFMNLRDIAIYGTAALTCLLLGYVFSRFSNSVGRKTIREGHAWIILASTCVSFVCTFLCWLVLGKGYESGQFYIILAIAYVFYVSLISDGIKKKIGMTVALTSIGTILSVCLLTDMSFYTTLGHGAFIVPIFIYFVISEYKLDKKTMLSLALVVISLFFIFAKGFMLRGSNKESNILSIENVCRTGPAKYVFADYMRTHMMDINFKEWEENIKEGDNVLIVTNTLHSNITTSYMFEKVNVCHYSTVDPAAYDIRLTDYWGMFPDKEPDVIVIDCWFGNPLFGEDTWIMKYIEKDFGYSESKDGSYLRFYRR